MDLNKQRPSKQPNAQDSPTRRQTVPAKDTTKNIHINIHLGAHPKLPSLKKIAAFFRRLFSTKRGMALACIIAVVLVSVSVAASSAHKQNIAKKAASAAIDQHKILENLEYQTVLPESKSIDALGGWKRVSPPNTTAVYAYVDAIDGIAVSVSQQPLPANFKNDIDSQVAELAKKFDATDKLTAGDTKVYYGTSAKGPQSVIFTKNGLLILMKSQAKISPDSWTKYIKSLN